MNIFKKVFSNKNTFVYIMIIMMMLRTVTEISFTINRIVEYLIFIGMIFFIADLFGKRNFINSRYSKILILYLISFGVTIVSNYKMYLNDNLNALKYTALFLLILYAYDKSKEENDMVLNMRKFNNIVIYISFVVSLVSVLTFVFFISYKSHNILQGFVSSGSVALWGIYPNPNTGGMVAVLSAFLTIINIYLYSNSINLFKKYFYFLNIVIQLIYLILCNSRGAMIAFLGGVFIGISYFIFNYLNDKDRFNKWSRGAVSLVLAILVCLSVSIVFKVSKKGLQYIPKGIGVIMGRDVNIDEIDLDREIDKDNITTGRGKIWRYGIGALKTKPLFGIGPVNIGAVKSKIYSIEGLNDSERGYIQTNNMHNGYLQILVSNGIVGFLIFISFMGLIIKDVFRVIFIYSNNLDRQNRIIFGGILVVVTSIAINGMFENSIILMVSYVTTILWVYLSYLSSYIDSIEKK